MEAVHYSMRYRILTDPWGVYIELTEGLAALDKQAEVLDPWSLVLGPWSLVFGLLAR